MPISSRAEKKINVEESTWVTSMLESQLRGRTAVRSLEPSRVDIIPFWSTFLIIVASTKYMSPYLSTAIPANIKTRHQGGSEAPSFKAGFLLLTSWQDGDVCSLPLFFPPFQPEHRSWNPPSACYSVLLNKWHQAGLSFGALKKRKPQKSPKHAKEPAECISLFLNSNSVWYIT